jgi:hypothetical protein
MNNFVKTIFYLMLLLSFMQVGRAQALSKDLNDLASGNITAETLKNIRLDEFRKIVLFDGKSISTNEMRFIDLREDNSIDMIFLKDNTVIDRTDILSASGVNKEPREEDKTSSTDIIIIIPDELKRELLLGVDGGGMTIPEDLLQTAKK